MVEGGARNGFDYRDPRVFPSARVSGGIQFGPSFAVMGGVRLDGLLTFAGQEALKTHSGSAFSVMGEGIEFFPHVFLGVKI